MTHNDIVQKLWNLCDVLRDDGINYSDYVTELVLLLFLKMVHENTEAGLLDHYTLPEGCDWTALNNTSGINLLNDYKRILLTLSTGKQTVADPDDPTKTIEKTVLTDPLILAIYSDAQTRLREPRHLEQLIKALDSIDWFDAKKDGLGDLYEGLLEKNANETKSGAGQYFTPRALINSMVSCIKPQAGEFIQDPAAGTAGFLIAADRYIKAQTDELYDLEEKQQTFQREQAFIGVELVPNTRRLALMNCLLHDMKGNNEGVVQLGNALGRVGESLAACDVVLANPPFGTAKGGEASMQRDFTHETSNKQLAFLQHMIGTLKAGGRAAVVLPDNVLFEANVGTDIRRDLMHKCNLHTILRLPTGIFYAAGVKTNVLFFNKGSATNPEQEEDCTKNIWIYDLRSNMPSFGKRNPFAPRHLAPFEAVYGQQAKGTASRKTGEWSFSDVTEQSEDNSRWRCFSREWIRDNKGDSLDIAWIKDKDSIEAADLPAPKVLATEAMTEMEDCLKELQGLITSLEKMT